MFLMDNKVYDVLKWIVMIVIPALTTAYVGLSTIWGWPYADVVAKTSGDLHAAGRVAGDFHGAVQ